ncbi:NOTCH1 [Acanthosepion pharaonis]|uniref:NOTCH1 n=1 Tax=Acanthosepion pharaonis TaxID=158019 RepID=A0A812CKU0_ACAPH|nr:NOTCH1 [Sepia pharaonis]
MNPCRPSAKHCMNNGTCHVLESVQGVKPSCTCQLGFLGTMCEQRNNKSICYNNPCKNGGTCVNVHTLHQYKCICRPGYMGNNCESIDYCASQPCRNAATCISNLTSFKCNCVTGYTGPTCAFDVNECDLIPNLCKNGGTCQNIPGSYMCKCLQQYTGKNCEKDYIPCKPSPCLNGGTCNKTSMYKFMCLCPRAGGGRIVLSILSISFFSFFFLLFSFSLFLSFFLFFSLSFHKLHI